MLASWFQNVPFSNIIQNFSPFYVFSIAISVLAVFLTWYFTKSKQPLHSRYEYEELRHELPSKDDKGLIHDKEFHVMSKVKRAKQKAIEKILTEQLSEEQRQHEKEIEKKQLSQIFQLLQEQEEKFQINSQEELHEQLKLYKNQ
ncbi:uncharacterized protein LOC124169849 isoform X2 [Ischnura elegans]|uniref:uncharacterized protein LOC124169849 isoform X2 n=1 Tax=Ischnura elegans TaxID=197161 RepID=UPI001ED8A8E1|nr:uncharacterized protein LOC124169849 isoform X2 [Ischnura elegans]